MFRKSRKKIVAAIMSILACLFLGTLTVIYASSYFEVSASNYEMLERYVGLYSLEEQPGDDSSVDMPQNINSSRIDDLQDERDGPPFEDTPAFRLSTFYSVAISDSGQILAADTGKQGLYTVDVLQEYARDIVKGGKNKGAIDRLIYLAENKDGYTIVAFMDNTIMQKSITTLFQYTLVFGSAAIAVLFFLAVYLAKRIVKPLEESYRKQKQFISDAGHELKTPVSVISTNAEMLSREIGDDKWLANIQYENERMGKLVSQLLELARTENVTPLIEKLDFSRLTAGEALPFESVAFEKGLVLHTNIDKKIFIDGNSTQLKQLLSILLDNAICHGTGGKKVYLSLTAKRGCARLSVINDGEDIPLEQKAQLFERFYRADEVRNGEEKHYGLGLAIAKAIVTTHNGKIDVVCSDGKVEFVVTIPLKNNLKSSIKLQ